MKEPAEPDAFALAAGADQIEAVVPVSRADQRQAVATDRKALVKGPSAVFE